MSAHDSINDDLNWDGPDDLQLATEELLADPAAAAFFEDHNELTRLVDSLVKLRKALSLSQTDVARRMGVKQPTVSGFENEGSDPRLSSLQRYARAVEGRLRLRLEMPATCDWVAQPHYEVRASAATRVAPATVQRSSAKGWPAVAAERVDRWGLTA